MVGKILTALGVLWLIVIISTGIKASYEYSKDIECYWHLADKSSTIAEKTINIDLFVQALENSNLQGEYNALVFKTPDNSFDNNLKALKSLQSRLHDVSNMNVSSFEYQTAIQQITGQEQGEATSMLCNLQGVWYKQHHFLLWNWVGFINGLLLLILLIVGIIWWACYDE
jgi:hypothetical protein